MQDQTKEISQRKPGEVWYEVFAGWVVMNEDRQLVYAGPDANKYWETVQRFLTPKSLTCK